MHTSEKYRAKGREEGEENKNWVKHELYHISNLQELGPANGGVETAQRGAGFLGAVMRKKCVSYITLIHAHQKEREGGGGGLGKGERERAREREGGSGYPSETTPLVFV